ncbi:MAG: DUF368 domain-containing protein [Bacilli bacterium]|nr:DUF368 domain-containing protein [Bacilli bacterium]
MKDKLLYVIKGFFFGLANIIPGVSGGTIAITMGIYEDMISSISGFFKNPKKSIMYLMPIGIGAVLSILLMSKVISFCLDKFPASTNLFFIGLIVGGIPLLTKKVKNAKFNPVNAFLLLLTFSIIMFMTFSDGGGSNIDLTNITFGKMILLFIIGMIAAGCMVIPGISGSFVLMLLGAYQPIISVIGDLTNFSNLGHNMTILIPFGIGVVVGIIVIAKILEYLFSKYEVSTYYAILGFIVASVIVLSVTVVGAHASIAELIFGIVLFVIGSTVGYKLGE